MNTTEHIQKAIYHLEQASNHDHSHLLYERNSEWTQRVLASAASRAALNLLTENTEVHSVVREAWVDGLPDHRHHANQRHIRVVDS